VRAGLSQSQECFLILAQLPAGGLQFATSLAELLLAGFKPLFLLADGLAELQAYLDSMEYCGDGARPNRNCPWSGIHISR
jgi:hypothetical protein